MTQSANDSCEAFLERLRQGDDDAGKVLFTRFAGQLVRVAQERLTRGVRRKLDPEDVLQSVLRSFVARCRDGQFAIENWNSLWGVLTVMTLRKCGHKIAYFHAACRDVEREVASPWVGAADASWQALAREPTPEEAAIVSEMVEQFLAAQEPRDREILLLHLQGHDVREISTRIGRAERTVRRAIHRGRNRLRRLQEEV